MHSASRLARTALLLATCSLTACADRPAVAKAPTPAPQTRPDTGAWPKPEAKEVLRVKAKGVQIYKATAGPDGLKWTFAGPEAELTDEKGQPAGKHYKGDAGPVWEHLDGSKVTGKKLAERPSPNADAVPELRLEAKSIGGKGVLSDVDLVERLNTTGGKPPPDANGAKAGEELRVPYTAEYVFYSVKKFNGP